MAARRKELLLISALLVTLILPSLHVHASPPLMMSDKKAAKIGREMYEEVTAQSRAEHRPPQR